MTALSDLNRGRWCHGAFALLALVACGGRESAVTVIRSGTSSVATSGTTSGASSGAGAVNASGTGSEAVSSGTTVIGSSGATSGASSGLMSGGSGAVDMAGTSSGMSMSGTIALAPCPTPTFAPPAGAVQAGTHVVISAAGLPAGGEILFTTDGTTPTRVSPVYNAGAVGMQVTTDETLEAISTTMGATCADSAVASATYTIGATPVPKGGPPGLSSPGCGKPWTGATGMWVSQPVGCSPGPNDQGTAACQAIPPGSPVPATASDGSPEHRGWWVYVPTGYDTNHPYKVIYNGAGCGDGNYFNAGEDGYPYYLVDNGDAILVGLDYDTYSDIRNCYDDRDPQSNDFAFSRGFRVKLRATFVSTRFTSSSRATPAAPGWRSSSIAPFPTSSAGSSRTGGAAPRIILSFFVLRRGKTRPTAKTGASSLCSGTG